jgi:hypothetical protein
MNCRQVLDVLTFILLALNKTRQESRIQVNFELQALDSDVLSSLKAESTNNLDTYLTIQNLNVRRGIGLEGTKIGI